MSRLHGNGCDIKWPLYLLLVFLEKTKISLCKRKIANIVIDRKSRVLDFCLFMAKCGILRPTNYEKQYYYMRQAFKHKDFKELRTKYYSILI